jgi:hypothetical protein
MLESWQWTDWHIHRLDWTPGRSVFFVDDIQWIELLFNSSIGSSTAPPANLKLCAPDDGKTSWEVRLASMDGRILALWSLLGILIVNY